MSSSNSVRLSVIEETVLGVTPVAGNFETVRFISESISGSPQTTESQQIRSDRLASGQIVTGLEVQGDVGFELAKDPTLDKFFASAMLSAWSVATPVTVDLEYDAVAKTITRDSGDFNDDLEVGDIITTIDFVNANNNTQHQVTSIVSATVIKVSSNATKGDLVSEVGTGTSYKRADKIGIGSTKKSFSFEKAFLDISGKALIYRGMMADGFNLNISYGEIVNGSFTFVGTGYENAKVATDFITNGRTIAPASTTNSLNGSVDMPFLNSSATGVLDEVSFCIQSLGLTLSNNSTAQTCIGKVAPKDYSFGTASVEVNLSAYLAADNWELLASKLNQDAFALGGMMKNADGWYGFYLPAIQVSFDDPSSSGANQDISLEMSGVAKVGPNQEKSLYLYKS